MTEQVGINVPIAEPHRQVEGRSTAMNARSSERGSAPNRVPPCDQGSRKVGITRAESTAMVDGHRRIRYDVADERDGSRPNGHNSTTGDGTDIDPPVPRPAARWGERPHDAPGFRGQ